MEASQEVFQQLKEKVHRPTFNVTNNQETKPTKAFLKTEQCEWQLVEPTNHRVKPAERSIQNFKNNFISVL